MHNTAAATTLHSNRFAAFLGRVLRRAETRFCPRRNGDSSSTSRSTRRASSSSSRAASALDGYNSSCKMVGLFRAINSDQLSSGNRELFHYSWISQKEIEKFLVRFPHKDTHVATAASAARPWWKPGRPNASLSSERSSPAP